MCFSLFASCAAVTAASAPIAGMTTAAALIRDIDDRVAHINAQMDMGASREEVVGEQFKALLHAFSQASDIELDVTTKMCAEVASVDSK